MKDIDNMNRPITTKQTEAIINNLPKQKALDPDVFIGEFYQTFKKEIVPILYNLF